MKSKIMKPQIIYISSPYTPDIEKLELPNSQNFDIDGYKKASYIYYRDQNIKRAEEQGKKVLLKGHTPIIPHNNTAKWEDDPAFRHITYDMWLNHCMKLLNCCDSILMCPGWQSSNGCRKEMKYFIKKVKGFIYYDISEVKRVG